MERKTVLIFGISSFVGSNLANRLKSEYRVIGTYYNTPVNIEGVLCLKCDITSKDLVSNIVLIFKPDITIYTIGLTNFEACNEFQKMADAMNTAGVFNVTQASERYNSKFIYFSSCYIFPGEDIYYRESDTPMPSTIYGNTVAASEFYIQKSCLNYIIFRCAPILGRSYNSKDLKWMEVLERFNLKSQRIICDTKIYTGFIDIWTLSELVLMAIKAEVTNRLFQLSSKDVMNRFEFATAFFDEFGGNKSLLQKGDWNYPIVKELVTLSEIPDEMFFKLSPFNVESEFDIEMPSIKKAIRTAKYILSGGKTQKKIEKGSGISFI